MSKKKKPGSKSRRKQRGTQTTTPSQIPRMTLEDKVDAFNDFFYGTRNVAHTNKEGTINLDDRSQKW